MVFELSKKVKRDFIVAGSILTGFSVAAYGILDGISPSYLKLKTDNNKILTRNEKVTAGIIISFAQLVDENFITKNNTTDANGYTVSTTQLKVIKVADTILRLGSTAGGLTLLSLGLAAKPKD